MKNFSLELLIDSNDLKIIKAATLKIILAKQVNYGVNVLTALETTPLNLTWLVLDPFEINHIKWNEEYSIYASQQVELTKGTVILKTSKTNFPATDAAYYSFTPSATFEKPFTGSGSPPFGSYKVNNNMPNSLYPALTFGLQQKASINGNRINPSPLNAVVVPATFPVTFTPLTIVYVWLQTPLTSGTVISGLPEKFTKVTFESSMSRQLRYDSSTGRFVITR